MPSTGNFRRLVAGSTGQRKSILRNLVSSLIIHESITTTLAKAKAVQPYAEQVITMGKKYSGRRDQRERATAYLYVCRTGNLADFRIGKLLCQNYSIHSQHDIQIGLEDILVFTSYRHGSAIWLHK